MGETAELALQDFDHQALKTLEGHEAVWAQTHAAAGLPFSAKHGGFHLVTRYQDVVEAARDHSAFSSASGISMPPLDLEHRMVPAEADPPLHSGYRALLTPFLTAERVAALEPKIAGFTHELLDRMSGRTHVEFVESFARPLPVLTALELLSLPRSDAALLETIVKDLHAHRGTAKGAEAARRLGAYLGETVMRFEATAKSASDDLMSSLVLGEVDSRRLTMPEKASILSLLLFGGFDTTRIALATAMWWLAGHPEDAERLRADPGLIPGAIEEFVRFSSPGSYLRREVVRETELGGRALHPGEQVLLSFAAANRDPAKFHHPNTIRIDRRPNAHIAFGAGVHRCIGFFVAKLELKTALAEILRRYSRFSLDPEHKVEWQTGENLGISVLPLRLGA